MRKACLIITCCLLYFSLRAQEWQPATAPPNFITDHSFGFSIDGKGYLVAGNEEFIGPSARFMQYEPASDAWTELEPFPGPARGYAIGDVWDRKAYFGFGTSPDSLLRDLWVFDPDSMKWTALASCPCDARTHPTLVANNGKIFVGLGACNQGNMRDWWEYDIASDQWSQKTDFPDLKRHHPYQFAAGDYVYSGFGHGERIFKEWFRYDPSLDTWDQMADLPAEGRVAGTQFSYNERGYVLSGDGDDHLSMDEGEFWEYNPEANTWKQLPSHPGKSRWAPASFIIDGVVYLFNGTAYFEGQGSFYQPEAYKFDLGSKINYPDMERVVSHQYNTTIYDVAPMTKGRWALAVKDLKTPQMLWEDSLSIVILDSTGTPTKCIIIEPLIQNEITEMGPIWVLPNDEFIVKYGVGNCDAGIFQYVLQKFDANGTSQWYHNFEEQHLPVNLALSPDGNVLFNALYTRMKIDIQSGEVLWEHGAANSDFISMLFVPGTEDIITGDTGGIKYYRHMFNGSFVTYELLQRTEMDLGDGTLNLLGINNNGVFYGLNTSSKELYSFRKDLQPSLVMLVPQGQNEFHNQFDFSDQHIAIGINFPDLEVRLYDTLGQLISIFENQLAGLSINDLKLSNDGIALFGDYQSGPTANGYPNFLHGDGRHQGWFKFNSFATEDDSTGSLSLSVIDIEQLELPSIDSFFSPGPDPGTLYNITGGKFMINVANTGNEVIDAFSLNTIFNYRTNYFFCAPVSANFQQFENEVINPGESVWVEFSGLLAQDQKIIPPQFCFWASGPNDLPDDHPEDDLFCIDNTVSTYWSAEKSISIFPNPANTGISLRLDSDETKDIIWKLIDVHGRTIRSGHASGDLELYTINVIDIPHGVYYLTSNWGSGIIVIQH
jgi:N-acetylneuraminic acid mutarotase